LAEAGNDIGIAVRCIQGIAIGVLLGDELASRRDEFDLIVAGLQAGELVVALLDGSGAEVVAGHRAGDEHAIAVVQLDDDIVDARLAAVLDAIGIGIGPDIVAQLGALQLDDQRLGTLPFRIDDRREVMHRWAPHHCRWQRHLRALKSGS
jgi:hypothetical protein